MSVKLKIRFRGLSFLIPEVKDTDDIKSAQLLLVDSQKLDVPMPIHTPALTFNSDYLQPEDQQFPGMMFIIDPTDMEKPPQRRLAVLPLKDTYLEILPGGSLPNPTLKAKDLKDVPDIRQLVNAYKVDADCLKRNRRKTPVGARIDLRAGTLEPQDRTNDKWSFHPKLNGVCYREHFAQSLMYTLDSQKDLSTDVDHIILRINQFQTLSNKESPSWTLRLKSSQLNLDISNFPAGKMEPSHFQAVFELCDPRPTRPWPMPLNTPDCDPDHSPGGAGVGCSPSQGGGP